MTLTDHLFMRPGISWALIVLCSFGGASCWAQGGRPPIETVLPGHYGLGVSSFSCCLDWPAEVKASHGIQWNYLYWYQLVGASQWYLETKLQRARATSVRCRSSHIISSSSAASRRVTRARTSGTSRSRGTPHSIPACTGMMRTFVSDRAETSSAPTVAERRSVIIH
jgi:hypothetical protein